MYLTFKPDLRALYKAKLGILFYLMLGNVGNF